MSVPPSLLSGRERPFNWRRAVANTLHELSKAGLMSERNSAAVLIGSYAHGTAMARSDIDILVLVPNKPRRLTADIPPRVHLQLIELKRFRERAEHGDDYAISALRFGRALYDPGHVLTRLRDEFAAGPWPDWREKIKYGRRRLDFGDRLLVSGDYDAGAEEYLLAATQIGRALLLRRQIYPLSRPELARQLQVAGEQEVAGILEELLLARSNVEQLRSLSSKLRDVLVAVS